MIFIYSVIYAVICLFIVRVFSKFADVAQLVEQPFRTRKVRGSNPRIGTNSVRDLSGAASTCPVRPAVDRRLCIANDGGSNPPPGTNNTSYAAVGQW